MKKAPLLALTLAACTNVAPPAPRSARWEDASTSIANPALALVCNEAWENELRFDPIFATQQNDDRYHGVLPDISRGGIRTKVRACRVLLERAAAIDAALLTERERTSRAMVVEHLENKVRLAELGMQEWTVDPLRGPQVSLLNLALDQPVETTREREQLVQRWRAMGRYVRQHAENLRKGVTTGRIASATAVEKALGQLDLLLSTPIWDSPLVAPAVAGGTWVPLARGETVSAVAHRHLGGAKHQDVLRLVNRHLQDGTELALGTRVLLPSPEDPLSPNERGRFLEEVLEAVEQEIYPSFAHYREVLAREVRPFARGDDKPGIRNVPDGDRAYRALIRRHTSLDLSPQEIHAFGLEEVARVRAEMEALGAKLIGSRDLFEIQDALRGDPTMHFTSAEEIEAVAKGSLARAEAVVPAYFGRLPRADCIIVEIPPHEAPESTVAYYREPAADGSRPGRYFVNTYLPETRTRYEAEVLAFHEAVPGHHTQIAIAQELEDLPLILRYTGSTAFVEGWALYTERLCDEMGLYSGDIDRLGMLSYSAWRACRLVVDTGMHALGWTRRQAIEYMLDNTLLAENNVKNEVDRYIAWPGQALAYKIGEREILKLRAEARAALGPTFSMAAFHDRVLENGAVTLGVLRKRIEAWIAAGGATLEG